MEGKSDRFRKVEVKMEIRLTNQRILIKMRVEGVVERQETATIHLCSFYFRIK
jgi:hypothetical protein